MSILEVVRSRARQGHGANLAAHLESAIPFLPEDKDCLGVQAFTASRGPTP